jgi:putative ABC transport system permease protein
VRDAWLNRARTLLVVVAIAVGLPGALTILDAWALVERATRDGYLASDPPAATLRTDSVDAALLVVARAVPGVRDVQARRAMMAAVQVAGSYRTAQLFTYDDFRAVRLGQLQPEAGAWPPADGALVIERSSVAFAETGVGDTIAIAAGGGEPRTVAVTGIVRDVGLAPGWMDHVVYGFVTRATLSQLGLPSDFNELRIVVSNPSPTRDEVRRVAYAVKSAVEQAGRHVRDVDVPEPGEHVHAAQMDSLLLTQGAFGLLALVVCGFLVVNLVTAMLGGQVREIGVMKSVGARQEQLTRMYLTFALALGVLASAIAVPITIAAGREYATLKADLLNFDVTRYATPAWPVVLQIVVGVLLPVVAATFPVRRGTRVSVAQALRDYGLDADAAPSGEPWLARAGVVPRPMLLSIRNAFRRRQRMVLTLLALASGGSVFLGARNLRAFVSGSLDLLFGSQLYSFTVRAVEPHAPDSLEAIVRRVAGVSGAEAWAGARGAPVYADSTLGNAFPISAPPAPSTLIAPRLVDGRWVVPGDRNALVVNRPLRDREPMLALGRAVEMEVAGRRSRWTVVGVVDAGPLPSGFASREALLAAAGASGVSTVAVATDVTGDASQVDLIQRVRAELETAGIAVASSQLLEESRRVTEDHLLMVVEFLGAMGWVMVVVGGMGLASTMSLAVLERTREIGVMRAVGAKHGSILAMVQAEGLVVALLSWAIALPLSLPMSVALGEAFSRVMLRVPVTWIPEAGGVVRWLGVVVIVSIVACAWPAIRATRVTVAAALQYE